jgi:small nuclear ribonucleoprotein (snRNP)-like protein
MKIINILFCLLVSNISFSQSTDKKNPTPIANDKLKFSGSNNTYYFSIYPKNKVLQINSEGWNDMNDEAQNGLLRISNSEGFYSELFLIPGASYPIKLKSNAKVTLEIMLIGNVTDYKLSFEHEIPKESNNENNSNFSNSKSTNSKETQNRGKNTVAKDNDFKKKNEQENSTNKTKNNSSSSPSPNNTSQSTQSTSSQKIENEKQIQIKLKNGRLLTGSYNSISHTYNGFANKMSINLQGKNLPSFNWDDVVEVKIIK